MKKTTCQNLYFRYIPAIHVSEKALIKMADLSTVILTAFNSILSVQRGLSLFITLITLKLERQ